jgi:hypothetical protein
MAYQGHSGRAQPDLIGHATWQVFVSGGSGIGATVEADDGRPFGGPFDWQDAGETGSPVYAIDPASGLSVEATAPSAKGWLLKGPEDDDEADDGPWSDYHGCRLEVWFGIDAEGELGQEGTRALELVTVAEGQRCIVAAHLGDGDRAGGISADGGAGSEYAAKAIAADTPYALVMDLRSTTLRGKLWARTGPLSEPALWDVEVPIAPSLDAGDRLELWFRVGNVIGAQRLTVRRIVACAAGRPGDVVVGELIGLAPGSTGRFPTAHLYEPGSLVATASGIAAAPNRTWPREARFGLDAPPTADAILRCRYVVAEPASDDP